MADPFKATPEQLRKVSGDLRDVGSRMNAVVTALQSQVGSEIGGACASKPGDTNSLTQRCDQVHEAGKQNAGVVDYWADYLHRAANLIQAADEAGTRLTWK